mgnify:CR=1 FL=1
MGHSEACASDRDAAHVGAATVPGVDNRARIGVDRPAQPGATVVVCVIERVSYIISRQAVVQHLRAAYLCGRRAVNYEEERNYRD